MVVNWEQELELLRYLEHEVYCIKVFMVVTLNVDGRTFAGNGETSREIRSRIG